jgi:hypothetical protein
MNQSQRTKTKTETPKTEEKIISAEEQPKFKAKTFQERRKEIPFYVDLFHSL